MGQKTTKARPLARRLCPGCGRVWRRVNRGNYYNGWDNCRGCGYEVTADDLPPTVDEMVRGLMTDHYHDERWTDLSLYVRGILRAVLPPQRAEVRRLRLDLKAAEAAGGRAHRRAQAAEARVAELEARPAAAPADLGGV